MTARRLARLLKIHGTVQGDGFRWSMAQAATRLGLCGWVRNCADGTVEALAVGGAEAIDAIVAWAREGPPGARVTQVAVSDAPPPDPLPAGFDIARGG